MKVTSIFYDLDGTVIAAVAQLLVPLSLLIG